MVGEIRDKETAEIAIHASLTGHLVLSTIHTNDSAGAVTRLVEMEIEPFLVRSSVIGILAQRLVRMLCQHCKVPYRPTDYELTQLGLDAERLAWKMRRNISPKYTVHGLAYEYVGADHDRPGVLQGGRLRSVHEQGLRRPARHLRAAGHRRRRGPPHPAERGRA